MTSVHVEKRPNGTYRVRVYEKVAGKWKCVREAGGYPSEREALDTKRTLEKQIRAGKMGMPSSPTAGACLDAYETAMEGKPSLRNVKASRVHLAPLDATRVAELDPVHIRSIVEALAKSSPSAAKKALDILRTAITRQIGTRDYNPAKDVKPPRIPKRKHRVLTADESRRLLPYIHETERDLFALSLLTGLRPSELASMLDVDVAPDVSRLSVRRSFTRLLPKDGDERTVALAPEARTIVKRLLKAAREAAEAPALHDPDFPTAVCLWPKKVRRISSDTGLAVVLHRAIRRACADGALPSLFRGWTLKCRRGGCGAHFPAGTKTPKGDERCARCGYTLWPVPEIVKVRWYDLRHTTGTLLIEAGVDAAVVTDMLGHHDVRFTMEKYIHLSDAKHQAAVKKLTLKKRGRK